MSLGAEKSFLVVVFDSESFPCLCYQIKNLICKHKFLLNNKTYVEVKQDNQNIGNMLIFFIHDYTAETKGMFGSTENVMIFGRTDF